MSKRGSYAVRISGLEEGNHDFSFELDRKFFTLFEHPEIEDGNVLAEVILEKKPGVFALHFSLKGDVEVVCDRCLEKFMTGISTSQSIFVKTGDTPGEIEDDVLMIGRDDHEIEVGQYLFEFIILALPYQKVHPEDSKGNSTCDPEMLKQLDAHRFKEPDQGENSDPRWDALKDIIEKTK
ncbi:MAG: DUF177 domain-containing protein [Bacteroidales bacterium]|nr:DUF177 domain-containing protein [Bacteroidales bacterium]